VLDVSRSGRDVPDVSADGGRFPDHTGRATSGERVVPLAEFRRDAARHGRSLTEVERRERLDRWSTPVDDPTPVEGPYGRICVFGGVYSNHRALEVVLENAARGGAERVYCLGDLGGFGPNPQKVWPLLESAGVLTISGNYEQSLAAGADDCNCGYADPRDNHFADLSYRYTAERCSPELRASMGRLPARRRVSIGDRELLLVHGSPRRTNEFLFRSTTPLPFLERLLDEHGADGLLCTHTGLHWHRRLPSGRDAVNVGAIGRPANDGTTRAWCAWIEHRERGLDVALTPFEYDHEAVAEEMRRERLPVEFVDTILTGWWTTCLEILPARERAASRY